MLNDMYPDLKEIATCYNFGKTELQIREDGDLEWRIVDTSVSFVGEEAKWELEVKPCKGYHFRIKVIGINDEITQNMFSFDKTLEPLSSYDSRFSGYKPAPLSVLVTDISSNGAKIVWNATDCSEKYDVDIIYVEEGKDIVHQSETVMDGGQETPFSMILRGLKPCKTYYIDTTVYLGNTDSPNETQFSTLPTKALANELNVTTISEIKYVEYEWPTYRKFSCIDEYQVEVCLFDNNICTSQRITQKALITEKLYDLKNCTKYRLQITPLYKSLNMEPKTVIFTTNCPSKFFYDNVQWNNWDKRKIFFVLSLLKFIYRMLHLRAKSQMFFFSSDV